MALSEGVSVWLGDIVTLPVELTLLALELGVANREGVLLGVGGVEGVRLRVGELEGVLDEVTELEKLLGTGARLLPHASTTSPGCAGIPRPGSQNGC